MSAVVDQFVKRIHVVLESRSPMIQQKKIPPPPGGKKSQPRPAKEEADLHGHWTTVGKRRSLAIPWVALYKSICAAASDFKGPNRKSMSVLVAATITCDLDMIPLGTDQYEVFETDVRIPPRTGPMVTIGRPRIPAWRAGFTLIADSEMYDVARLQEIIDHAGKLVGLGAWRPSLKGPYGRFRVAEFEIL